MKKSTKCIIIAVLSVLLAAAAVTGGVLLMKNNGGNIVNPPEREGFIFTGGAYTSDTAAELPEALSEVSVSAVIPEGGDINSRIIPTTASFTIKTAGKTDEVTLSQYLSVSPAVPFSVQTVSDTEFVLTPDSELNSGGVYRFVLGDPQKPSYSFAFQTEREMVIKSTLPADLALDVPVNTGIELVFTDTLSGVKLGDYFKIEPAADGRIELYPDGKTAVFIPEAPLDYNTVYTVTVKSGVTGASGKALAADYGFKFRTGSSSANVGDIFINPVNEEMIFSPDEYPTAYFNVTKNFYYQEDYTIGDAAAALYKYDDAGDAVSAMMKFEREKSGLIGTEFLFDKSGLDLVYSGNIKPESSNGGGRYYSRYGSYISLPKQELGVYLLEYTVSVNYNSKTYSRTMQSIIVISNLRLHTESYNGDTLYWVTDSKGSVVSGAEITATCYYRQSFWSAEESDVAFTAVTGSSDGDGICILDCGDTNNSAFVTASYGGDTVLITQCGDEERERGGTLEYIFTDREVYFADDTVNYSGIISAYGKKLLPQRLYVYIGTVPYGTVAVSADGSFTGSVPIEAYSGYGFAIRFCDDDGDGSLVCTKFISVTQDDKPVYRASISFDRLFYEFGDTITATVSASFYDGTPAAGLRFLVCANDYFSLQEEVTTDDEGLATVKLRTRANPNFYSSEPVHIYFSAELMGYETSTVYAGASTVYIHSENQFRTERVNGEYSEVYLNKTDTGKLLSADDLLYPGFPGNIIGEPASGKVDIQLKKYTYVKRESGTNYDPITKTTYKNYYYDTVVTTEKSYTGSFENGVLRLEHINVGDDENASYVYELVYHDTRNGADYKSSVWAVVSDRESGYNYYDDAIRLTLDRENGAYAPGEYISAAATRGGKALSSPALYTVYGENGLSSYHVDKNGGGYTFAMTDEMTVSSYVYAAVYDEGKINNLQARIYYDYTQKSELSLEIIPDKTEYRPGEVATLSLILRDSDGNPVAGTVNLAVVDEACFSLGEQRLTPAGDYFCSPTQYIYDYGWSYNWYYGKGSGEFTPVIDSRFFIFDEIFYLSQMSTDSLSSSYSNGLKSSDDSRDMATPETEAPSESADGGGQEVSGTNSGSEKETYIRKYFADNPVFTAVTSDKTGSAVLSFTVPDNITEWRITAVAAADMESKLLSERKLGHVTTDIICTLPYFLNVSACEYYIAGDDVALSARSVGTAISASDEAAYTAVLYSGDTELSSVNIKADAGDFGWINFGKLESGSYSVVIKAECRGLTDGAEVSFDVYESANIVPVCREVSIDGLHALTPLQYPLTLSFYNTAGLKFSRAANMITRGYVPTRADSAAAYYAARLASGQLYGTDEAVGTETLSDIKAKLSAGSGYIALTDYDTPSLTLSAEILAVSPDSLSAERRQSIIDALYSYLDGGEYVDETELCSAVLGLAAAGEPVLDRLYYIAGGCASYPLDAKLYLCAAFAHIGDFGAANDMYSAIIAEHGKTVAGINDNGELYIDGGSTEASISLTAKALLTASVISRDDAYGMINYMYSHTSQSGYYGLYIASYLRFYIPSGNEVSTLRYSFGDEPVEIELRAGRVYTLSLTKTGFDTLQILDGTSGDLTVHAVYGGSPDDALSSADNTANVEPDFTIEKTITPYDEAAGLYLVALRYSGTSDRNFVSFSIADRIPSGARFVSSLYRGSEGSATDSRYISASIYNDGGQQMTGHVYVWTPYKMYKSGLAWNDAGVKYSFGGTLYYIVRGAVKGDFIAESAMMRDCASGVYATSPRLRVTIDDKWDINEIK